MILSLLSLCGAVLCGGLLPRYIINACRAQTDEELDEARSKACIVGGILTLLIVLLIL